MRVVMGLGNPGARYDATRHNVGWWAADRLAYDWNAGSFREEGPALRCEAQVEGERVVLLKPTTYMNRSGAALIPFVRTEGFDPSRDLLVMVDDATREAGRLRLRPGGSSGGHNGLKSIEAVVGREFPRLRIGVGVPPSGADLVDWVLSSMDDSDEEAVLALIAELPEVVASWIRDGTQPTMNQFNR